MNRCSYCLIFLFLIPQHFYGQGGLVDSIKTRFDTVTYWTKGANVAFNFQQIGLKNWTAGGDELFSLNFNANGFANKELEKYIWFNSLDASYNLSRQGDKQKIRANKDRWKATTKLSRKLDNGWLLTLGLTIQSQFNKLYKITTDPDTNEEIANLSSNFFSPGYIWPSIGFTYNKKDYLKLSVQPLTGKITSVLNDSLSEAGAFGVLENRKVRSEVGFGLDASYKQLIIKNIIAESELSTFSRFREVLLTDVRWDVSIRFKVNRYVSGQFSSNLIYDKETIDEIQFRYSISIGFSYDIDI